MGEQLILFFCLCGFQDAEIQPASRPRLRDERDERVDLARWMTNREMTDLIRSENRSKTSRRTEEV